MSSYTIFFQSFFQFSYLRVPVYTKNGMHRTVVHADNLKPDTSLA